MRKIVIAVAIIAVTGLASLTVSSKTTSAKPVEKIKTDISDFNVTDGYRAHKTTWRRQTKKQVG